MDSVRRTCSLPECEREARRSGLCKGHLGQQERGEAFGPLRSYRIDSPHVCTIHKPGEPGCYRTHSCRCAECRASDGLSRKRRRVRQTAPIDANRSRRLLRDLAVRGWLTSEVAAATGVPYSHLVRVRRSSTSRVLPRTEQKIVAGYIALSRQSPPMGDLRARGMMLAHARKDGWGEGLVSGLGTNRRLRALSAMGWLDSEVGGVLGVRPWTVMKLRTAFTVKPAEAAGVAAAYDALSMKIPPDDASHRQRRSRARTLGWEPPLAWDDEAIDDPDGSPRGLGSDAFGRLDLDEVEWLMGGGETLEAIASRMNYPANSITSAIHRNKRSDLKAQVRHLMAI